MHVPRLAVIKNYRLQSLFKKSTWTMLSRQAIACMPCMFACSPFWSPFLAEKKHMLSRNSQRTVLRTNSSWVLCSLVLFHSACQCR